MIIVKHHTAALTERERKMLAALRLCEDVIDDFVDSLFPGEEDAEAVAALNAARDAIAVAEQAPKEPRQ